MSEDGAGESNAEPTAGEPHVVLPQPDRPMALPAPEGPPDDEEIARYFEVVVEKIGFLPNVLKAYQVRPAHLRNFIAMYNELMLGESGLSRLEREMIAVTVSAINRCYYCLVAHGQAVRRMSNNPELGEVLALNYRAAELPRRQRRLLDYAAKLTTGPGAVTEADRAALREVGLSDADIFDTTEVVSFFNMTNRMAHGLDMRPNREYHSLDR